jgi:hypothetical protein
MLCATLSHSDHDVSTCHVLRSLIVGMASLQVMHISNHTAVDALIFSNANLYVVLAISSSYFRACQEGADCFTAVLGLSFCE